MSESVYRKEKGYALTVSVQNTKWTLADPYIWNCEWISELLKCLQILCTCYRKWSLRRECIHENGHEKEQALVFCNISSGAEKTKMKRQRGWRNTAGVTGRENWLSAKWILTKKDVKDSLAVMTIRLHEREVRTGPGISVRGLGLGLRLGGGGGGGGVQVNWRLWWHHPPTSLTCPTLTCPTLTRNAYPNMRTHSITFQ